MAVADLAKSITAAPAKHGWEIRVERVAAVLVEDAVWPGVINNIRNRRVCSLIASCAGKA